MKEGPFVVKVDINYDEEDGSEGREPKVLVRGRSPCQHICTELYVDGVCIRGLIGRASPVCTYTVDRHRVDIGGGQNEMRELTFAKPKVEAIAG